MYRVKNVWAIVISPRPIAAFQAQILRPMGVTMDTAQTALGMASKAVFKMAATRATYMKMAVAEVATKVVMET